MNKCIKKMAFAVVISLVGFSNSAIAQEQDKWQFTLAPLYLWATGIEGESQIGPVTAPVNITFQDALDNLEAILTFHFEMQKKQWGLMFDAMHINLAPQSTLPNGVPLTTDLTNNVYEFGVTYRTAKSKGLEVLGGVRWVDFSLDAALGGAPSRNITDQSWVDGFVGLRYMGQAGKKGTFILRGDIGTGDSDFVWNALIGFDYRFAKNFSMLVAYRWLDYDYETGTGPTRFTYDVQYQGPALAAVFNW